MRHSWPAEHQGSRLISLGGGVGSSSQPVPRLTNEPGSKSPGSGELAKDICVECAFSWPTAVLFSCPTSATATKGKPNGSASAPAPMTMSKAAVTVAASAPTCMCPECLTEIDFGAPL